MATWSAQRRASEPRGAKHQKPTGGEAARKDVPAASHDVQTRVTRSAALPAPRRIRGVSWAASARPFNCRALTSPPTASLRLGPVLDLETGDSGEVLLVVGHERGAYGQRVGGDERVHLADRDTAARENGCNGTELGCGSHVEGEHVDASEEGVDGAMDAAGPALVGSEPKLRYCDGAEAQAGALLVGQAGSDLTDTAESKADRVSVEHEQRHGSIEGVSELRQRRLLGAWQASGQRAESLEELIRPVVDRLKDNSTPDTLDDNFSVTFRKPAIAGKPDGLAAPIPEQLCAVSLHEKSIYPCQYNATRRDSSGARQAAHG